MTKLAVNLSMIFTEVPLLERFALAQTAGFKHVEIQFPYELSIEQIQTQLRLHDLSLCLINVPAGDLMTGGNGLAGVPGKELELVLRSKLHSIVQVFRQGLNFPLYGLKQVSRHTWT
jgi:hydroxypyruvate isomerase